MNKTTIRAELLLKRKQLSQAYIDFTSFHVISHIVASQIYQDAQHIALYLSINGEVDLTALLNDSNKTFYIPAIQGNNMQFQPYTVKDELELHRFGVKQPQFNPSLPALNIDLCLVPLVGFDLCGNRIGMGGGYYDRYFADNRTVLLAGVAYDFQMIEQLPADTWDVKLQHIFTEHKHHIL